MNINFTTSLNINVVNFFASINHPIEKNYLKIIPDDVKNKYKKNIIKANELLNKYLKPKLLYVGNWNICLTVNNYMYGFPMTYENIIFMPYNYNSNLVETLIHERIHICQRYKTDEWIKLIDKRWKINNTINPKGIVNPDTHYVKYTFGNYYGYLVFQDGIMKVKWIDILTNKNVNFNLKYEHPFELLAYKLSNKIINLS